MAVTYKTFVLSAPVNPTTEVTAINFTTTGDNKVSIAYTITAELADGSHPTHDSVVAYNDYSYTKLTEYTQGYFKTTIWYYIGMPTFSLKNVVATFGETPRQWGAILGVFSVSDAYQSADFILMDNYVTSSDEVTDTETGVDGSMVLGFSQTFHNPLTYQTWGAGTTNRGSSSGATIAYNLVSRRLSTYFGSEPVSGSSVTFSATTAIDVDFFNLIGVQVLPYEFVAPPWWVQRGEYIEPPCGYVGQVISTQPDLSHLEGQTVSILANGQVLPEQVVENGTVNVSSTYSLVHIGLPYYSDLETLRINVPLKGVSTMQAVRMRINNVTYFLKDTKGGYIGPDEDNLWEAFTPTAIRQYSGNNIGDDEIYTGKIRQPLGDQYGNGGSIFFRQSDPLPVTIGAIMPEVDMGGISR